jgi:hypothetical protein
MKYILLPALAISVSIIPASAQYHGGTQDGYSIFHPKDNQNGLPLIYSGGPNDGYAIHDTGSQNASPGIYFGGNNDGYAFQQAKGTQNGSPDIYTGGSDDGFSSFATRTQNALPDIYTGGQNDGVALAFASVQNSIPPIYLGGINDGVDMSTGKGDQNRLPPIYKGGITGEVGDAEDGYSFTVSLRQNPSEQPPTRGDRERAITLLQLSGAWFNEDAILGWRTDIRPELDHFEMQRSIDGGKSFEMIGSITLNPEAGQQQDYRYTDLQAYHLPADYLLYRLKCVDKNGAFQYSAVVRLAMDKTAPVIMAYPNPTSGRFTLAIANAANVSDYEYTLTTSEGKILKRGTVEDLNTSFDLSSYAAATYRLFITQKGKPIQHFTILLTK